MKIITETNSLKSVGPYSLAISINDLIYLSGQIGIDNNLSLVSGGVNTEFKKIIENTKETLSQFGCTLDHIISIKNYLTDLNDFKSINNLYKKFLSEPFPTRTTIQVAGLPLNAAIEVEIIASINQSRKNTLQKV